jgi:hypothetical protein
MNINDYNVLFITLDSLSFSVAKEAKRLYLNEVSQLRKAETHGTYTYPAHHSFFIGLIPRLIGEDNLYLGQYKQIWRSTSAKKSDREVFANYSDKNILDFYHNQGYQVVGVGGVPFFNVENRNNTLPNLFEEFYYMGPKEHIPREERVPRREEWFPLNNIGLIKSKIKNERFFLFINSIATHIPYDNPNLELRDSDIDIVNRIYREHDLKIKYNKVDIPFEENEINRIKEIQCSSLKWVDKQIDELIMKLPKERPLILIVCADHGEEFGEHGRFGHAHLDSTVMEVPYWDTIIGQ